MPRCPICGKEAILRPANPAGPFCSPRCKAIDLGKWVNEEYRVPGAPSDDADDAGDGAKQGAPEDER